MTNTFMKDTKKNRSRTDLIVHEEYIYNVG